MIKVGKVQGALVLIGTSLVNLGRNYIDCPAMEFDSLMETADFDTSR